MEYRFQETLRIFQIYQTRRRPPLQLQHLEENQEQSQVPYYKLRKLNIINLNIEESKLTLSTTLLSLFNLTASGAELQ